MTYFLDFLSIISGSEFLIPITGYYCQLCEEFLGDPISGEQHVKGHQHNEKYKVGLCSGLWSFPLSAVILLTLSNSEPGKVINASNSM